MFCKKCGLSLPEGAMFCSYCGTSQSEGLQNDMKTNVININQDTKFVPGTCTNCGASLQVNPNLKSAICPACGTPYIVQQAINNFIIHGTENISIENAVIVGPTIVMQDKSTSKENDDEYSVPAESQKTVANSSSTQKNTTKKGTIGGIITLVVLIMVVRSCFFSNGSQRSGTTSVGVYDSSLLQKGEDVKLDSEHNISNVSYRVPNTWYYRENDKFMYFYPESDGSLPFLMVYSEKTSILSINDSTIDGVLDAKADYSKETPIVFKREIEQKGDYSIARLDYELTLNGYPCEFNDFFILDSKTGILYLFEFISEDKVSEENLIYFNEITRSIELK